MNLTISPYVATWVQQHIPNCRIGFDPCSAIGVLRGDEIIAGVVYHEYRPHYKTIQMSCAALPGVVWLTRGNLKVFFDYPFNQLGCERITAYVAAKNTRARKLDEHLGFIYEGVARKAFGNDDGIIYGMLREDCRFIDTKIARIAA